MKFLKLILALVVSCGLVATGQLNYTENALANSGVAAGPSTKLSPLVNHVVSYDLPNARTALYLDLNAPKECVAGFVRDCYVYVKNSQDTWVYSKRTFVTQVQILVVFSASQESVFSQGGPTLIFGTETSTIDRMLKPETTIAPPADSEYKEVVKIPLTKDYLSTDSCNPLQALVEKTEDLSLKRDIMNSLIYSGQSEVNGYIAPAEAGIELEGLTQPKTTKQITFGYPIQGPYFQVDFPLSGLYRTSADVNAWAPVLLDCSKLVSARTSEYQPFRLGVDGIVMYFKVLEDNTPSDTWITISGKTYQIERNGKDVVPTGGLFKRCGAIVKDFYFGDWVCFVPKKSGTFQVTVTQKYRGSGNLLIKCRSGFYGGVYCSSTTDRSVTAKKTGRFTVSPKGIVSGPDFWAF